ncbi:MAG: hypothetical protein VX877_03665, partial [Planctomycetota bacterium]|nr:hypothetical protein [Planctomycetota bacterium]
MGRQLIRSRATPPLAAGHRRDWSVRDYRQLEVEVVGLVLPGLAVLEAKLVAQVKPARRVDQEVALPPLLHLAQVSRVPLAYRELPVACRVLPVACRVLPVACRVLPVA